jgi:hypothetical protein
VVEKWDFVDTRKDADDTFLQSSDIQTRVYCIDTCDMLVDTWNGTFITFSVLGNTKQVHIWSKKISSIWWFFPPVQTHFTKASG